MAQPTSSPADHTYMSQAIDTIYAQYERFDETTNRIASSMMGYSYSAINTKDPKIMFVSGALKIAAIALVVLAAYSLLAHPFLLIASIGAGALVRPEKATRESIESWVREGYTRAIVPIIENESIGEKVALGALLTAFVAATLTTVLAPMAMGIFAGYKFASMGESPAPAEPTRRPTTTR